MKLIKNSITELSRKPGGSGLFTTELRYKVAECSGELNYVGPKIPHEVWQQVLSFFKWSFDTHKSEAQVRLFVNPKLATWRAWAFPQSADWGLSTKEVSNDEAKKQRAELFGETDSDWTAWGTVHHHCDIAAFQSGTDESDEKNVGGLHITVGDMGKPQHSLHARLYHQGDMFEPDMSVFWDIGTVLDNLPLEVRAMLPGNGADLLARRQMCTPSTVEFPEQWKANMLKREVTSMVSDDYSGYAMNQSGHSVGWKEGEFRWFGGKRHQLIKGEWVESPFEYGSPQVTPKVNGNQVKHRRTKGADNLDPLGVRAHDAMEELLQYFAAYNLTVTECEEVVEEMSGNEPVSLVLQVCKDYSVIPDDIMDEMRRSDQELGEKKDEQVGKQDPQWGDDL